MAQPFLGQITIMGFGFAPKGYASCSGQLLALSQNNALFALLGVQYGGDGIRTFALPNLQGSSPISALGSVDPNWQPAIYAQGMMAGTENVTLTADQVPAHVHMLMATTKAATDGDPSDGESLGTSTAAIYGALDNLVPLGGGLLGPAGAAPHPNMQPFLTINMCIALQGVFPSRN